MKGRTDRFAVIHAVYALAWAAFACAERPRPIALLLPAGGVVVALLSVARLKHHSPTQPADRPVSETIIAINVATGSAIVGAIIILHALSANRHVVPTILVVMAIHFIPLWRLLGRPSLAAMGVELAGAAAIGASGGPSDVAPLLASLIFLVNGALLAVYA